MKKIYFLFCVLFTTLVAYSQTDMTVSIPGYDEFVVVNTDGLNLRKQANASSPKLMAWNSDDGSYETVTKYYFEGEGSTRYKANSSTGAWVEAVHPGKGDVLPMIGESGDWYKVVMFLQGNNGKTQNKAVYIMKRYASKHTAVRLDAPFAYGYETEGEPASNLALNYRTNGTYTKIPFAVTMLDQGSDDDYFSAQIVVPVMAGDHFVCMQQVNMFVKTSNSFRLTLDKVQEENVMTGEMESWTQASLYMPRVSETNRRSGVINALKSLSDDDFLKLVNFACKEVGMVYGKLDDGTVFQLDCTPTIYVSNSTFKANASREPNGTGFKLSLLTTQSDLDVFGLKGKVKKVKYTNSGFFAHQVPDGPLSYMEVTFNRNGKLTSVDGKNVNNNANLRLVRDSQGRINKIITVESGETAYEKFVSTYTNVITYDANGRKKVINTNMKNDNGITEDYSYKYSYDNQGRLFSEASSFVGENMADRFTDYQTDSQGNWIKCIYTNGISGEKENITRVITYWE